MIQDIAPHHFNNAYRPVPPQKESIVLYYEDQTCLMKHGEEGICFPTFADLERISEGGTLADREMQREEEENYGLPFVCTYLFSIDDLGYYLAEEPALKELPEYRMEDIRIFRNADPQHTAFAGITGHHLYHWYQKHRFCGQCGAGTRRDKKERMLYCEKCGNMEYPNIAPAVIIGVTDGNRLLLSKYAGRSFTKYALLAGYTEIGETMEETVQREVMEEVGLKVKNVRYYKSQPWAFSETELMGFYCELDGTDAITLDEEELALAEWFEREQIPVTPSRDSLTNEMIMAFKNGTSL